MNDYLLSLPYFGVRNLTIGPLFQKINMHKISMSWRLFTASFRFGLYLAAALLCCFALFWIRPLYLGDFSPSLDFVTFGLASCRYILFLLLQYPCCFLIADKSRLVCLRSCTMVWTDKRNRMWIYQGKDYVDTSNRHTKGIHLYVDRLPSSPLLRSIPLRY